MFHSPDLPTPPNDSYVPLKFPWCALSAGDTGSYNGDEHIFLSLKVKKAVGGSVRGMALYEDDVRHFHNSYAVLLIFFNLLAWNSVIILHI